MTSDPVTPWMVLLAWWNVAFLAPVVVGIMLALISSLGVTGGDGEADGEVDADVDSDVGADAGELEADLGGEAEPADLDDAGDFAGVGVMALLGVGRVPLVLHLTTLLLAFGAAGWAANRALAAFMPALFPVSLAIAVAVSVLLSRALARLVSALMPRDESYASTFAALAGCSGKVVSVSSRSEGWAHVTDACGNFIEAHCRLQGGGRLAVDAQVIVLEATPDDRICTVAVIDDEQPLDELTTRSKRERQQRRPTPRRRQQ